MTENGKVKCIVVDDDPLSRRLLTDFIERTEALEMVGEYAHPLEARQVLMNGGQVDLILLDVEMPGMNGIELLHSLSSPPSVIIVSGKEDYAFQAFDNDVADYLLKPVEYSRFLKAIDKAVLLKQNSLHRKEPGEDVLYARKGSHLFKVYYKDILFVEAMENYVTINTWYDKITIHFTMKALEEKLPTELFYRVHRSYIVNLHRISKLRDGMLEVRHEKDMYEIPVGKAYRKELIEYFTKEREHGK